jgi:tetratricopeptide (TPR) repeat protein
MTPDLAPLWSQALGLLKAGRDMEAEAALAALLGRAPDYAAAWTNLGVALRRQGRFGAAEAAARRGLALPGGATEAAWSNLGNLLRDQGRFAEADDAFIAAVAAGGGHGTRYNRALLLRDRGRLDDALAEIAPALAAEPANPQIQWDHALIRLQAGDWRTGFEAYEARWRLPGVPMPASDRPWWTGEPLAGRTLLLTSEQGMGDVIQFGRFIAQIPDDGRIVLALRRPLLRLFRTAPALERVRLVDAAEPLPPHDLILPLLSLPRVLRATPETLPPPLAFQVPQAAVAAAEDRLAPRGGRRRLGLVWAGSSGHRNDRNRSAPLGQFLPLLADPAWDVFSFQVGPHAAELGAHGLGGLVRDLAPLIDDFLDTAAFLLTIERLVTVDTGIAHLAGSLDVSTSVLVPEACDWRWGVGVSASPWYSSLSLVRQPRQGDWSAAVAQVAHALV